jgi:hypothetical protein
MKYADSRTVFAGAIGADWRQTSGALAVVGLGISKEQPMGGTQ